jgi:death on curing protein
VTIFLTFEEVLAIHDTVAESGGIRDAGAIQPAVGRPQATVFGEDAYSTIYEKAGAFLQSLACDHGWVNGNKRTAWVAALTFLTVNDHPLDPGFDQDAAEEFMVTVAGGRYTDVPDIAAELVKFTRR